MVRVQERNPACIQYEPNLFQSPFWARFKEVRGYETQAFRIECENRSTNMIIIHRPCAEDALFGYVPHGPEIPMPQDRQGPLLEEISEYISPHLPENCFFLRYEPPWPNPYAVTRRDGAVECRPPEPRVREMRMNFGCRNWNLRKAATDMQPMSTVLLDLGRTANDLLRDMHSKTRYCIRKSFRHGVLLTEAGAEALPLWHPIYQKMAARKKIVAEDEAYFKDLFATAGRHQCDLRLTLAWHGGKPVAGNIIAFHNATAYYLYSAASGQGRKKMASYGALWKSFMNAKRRGFRWFDLMGIPPNRDTQHPMHGLYRFKTRFGGQVVHFRGCWDYPFENQRYSALALSSALKNPFHVR
jgi:lipid II:glycine glycyltransferase (peptidoglycan interpeptide bridge formation enzyme)